MSISKLLSFIIIIVVTCSHSQGGDPIACVRKLLPCQAYLKKGSRPPSAACCVPLKQILGSDRQCLCTLFTDPALMKSLNVTRDDAINLANSCGAHADSSLCKPPASAPSTSTPTSPLTNSTAAASPPVNRRNAATSVSPPYVGCFLSLAPIFNLIVFAF